MRSLAALALRHKFLGLLIVLTLLLVVEPILFGLTVNRVLLDLAFTVITLSALLVLYPTRRIRVAAILLAGLALAMRWSGYAFTGDALRGFYVASELTMTLFLILAVGVVVRHVLSHEVVSMDTLAGAVCGYLLLGVAFAGLYMTVDALTPDSFRGSGDFDEALDNEDSSRSLLLYYSFITLTTVGYGDITR
jgi:hypothetical protein